MTFIDLKIILHGINLHFHNVSLHIKDLQGLNFKLRKREFIKNMIFKLNIRERIDLKSRKEIRT